MPRHVNPQVNLSSLALQHPRARRREGLLPQIEFRFDVSKTI
nr:hypothetical protein JVH1_6946 [Rhodococcus sp. JVH1]